MKWLSAIIRILLDDILNAGRSLFYCQDIRVPSDMVIRQPSGPGPLHHTGLSKINELPTALKKLFAHDGPTMLENMTDPERI